MNDFEDTQLVQAPTQDSPFAVNYAKYENLLNKDLIPVFVRVSGTTAASSTNYGKFFHALRPYEVMEIVEEHEAAGTDASAVTLNIERLSGVEALGAGDTIAVTAFNLKSTARTPVTKKTSELQNRKLVPGDRLALEVAGTLTAVNDVQVTILLKPLGKGDYR